MAVLILFAFLMALQSSGVAGIKWSHSDLATNDELYACANGTLSLPWNLTMEPSDVIENIQWFVDGGSQEMIATESHGNFLVLPAFAGRVTQTTNSGIDIQHVQTADSGNYSVEVIAQSGTINLNFHRLHSHVQVDVTDGILSNGGQLNVIEQPTAEYDNATNEYHVVLSCGSFVYINRPSFDATWDLPSLQTVGSSSYGNGSFHLKLTNPVEGGTYTCRVPLPTSCLHGGAGAANITVKKMESRMLVMDARQKALESTNQALQTQLTNLQIKNADAASANSALAAQLNRTVSFHARLTVDVVNQAAGTDLVLTSVLNDQGRAYSNQTGRFTAPYNATYCFLASTEDSSPTGVAAFELVVDGTEVATVVTNVAVVRMPASLHAVLPLTAGQKVWLRVALSSNNHFWSPATAFSGFLVN